MSNRKRQVKQKKSSAFFGDGIFDLPKLEEKVLQFWRTNKIFEKSLALRPIRGAQGKRAQGKKHFVFFEGPPTANGKPGIHHVLARAFKDVVLRYKTMAGFFVPRKGGWDTHGLPVELEVEKALGFKSKKDIEKFGIAEFNKKCKESVWKYKDEWERLTERMGFWLDLKNPYITYENNYIETLWWIIKEIWKKKLLYKGHRVAPWCPRCGTALSSHEMALGYKEVEDQSVYVKFKLKKGQKITKDFTTGDKTYILSWTTTPWTLPGNVALAVGEGIEYVVCESTSEHSSSVSEGIKELERTRVSPGFYLVGKDVKGIANILRKVVNPRQYEEYLLGERKLDSVDGVIAVVTGKNLVGLQYEPLFNIKSLQNKNSHKIYAADFVNTEEGTGVVHTAVMYGEDDYQLGVKVGLPQHHTVDEQGKFTKEVPGLGGLFVKAKETEEKIFKHLEKHGNLFKVEKYTHEYPFCWRCDTPLLYYARTSWFVAMSKLRQKLLAANKTINWIPGHLKDGRFGEWLREVKDWNFSRERYWGTPLPIWECQRCKTQEVIGSAEELSERAARPASSQRSWGGAKNEYWVMRHGQSETQLLQVIDSGQGKYALTPKGRGEVQGAAKKLRKEKIDLIISSDILRTRESAKIAAHILGVKKIVFDKRLREIKLGEFTGCHDKKYHAAFPTYESRFAGAPEGGESLREVRSRLWNLMQTLEKKYRGKKILFMSHEYPIWMLVHIAEGQSEKEAIRDKESRGKDYIKPAEARKINFRVAPRDETGLADFHRPYIDAIVLQCARCKSRMERVRELADVWFDSGSMPFAQAHWPFENSALRQAQGASAIKSLKAYPADFIAEAVDQTRGWFYTLLAVATLLGKEAPYKNVISPGLVLDKHGQKMSKSKGNVVDPGLMIQKYGIDAVRWYFYTASPVGEPMNFDEVELQKTIRRFHMILYNCFAFWGTYAKQVSGIKYQVSRNVLDKWILTRLNETVNKMTHHMDRYEIREAALVFEALVDDLSRWYIRRSRRRFSAVAKGYGGQAETRDYRAASATLGYVLAEIAKLLAPFNPFFAEALYYATNNQQPTTNNQASVHLVDWPLDYARGKPRRSQKPEARSQLLAAMSEVRRLASLALARRAEAGIKVRQPLATLKIQIPNPHLRHGYGGQAKFQKELLNILAEEVNVKKVMFDAKIKEEVELDTTITPELKKEGIVREFVRMVADLRAKANLKPQDTITLFVEASEMLRGILSSNEKLLKKEVGAKSVEYKKSKKFDAELSTKFEDSDIWIGIKKIC